MPDNIYAPPFLFGNGHIQTIFPVIFRKVEAVWYERERITTFDNDFLDLDWSTHGHKRLAIVSHGLEGNSSRAYVKGMVKAINHGGWDALAWNYRSCSGEPNRRLRSYHNGV
ncbi:MAG: alpha/beta hydrolase, partial [Proteobacteria bacterium]|nr:alpha/beta hydrolase [Pseudomonadota bacterium]